MAIPTYREHVQRMGELLSQLEVTNGDGEVLTTEEGFEMLYGLAVAARIPPRRLFLIGNGASASMASHFAADLCKNGGVNAGVLTDPALTTAFANDIGADQLFAEPLRRMAAAGNGLLVISSSGASANLIAALAVAGERQLSVATITAMSPENLLRRGGDLNFYIPAMTYGDAESCHAAVLHYWLDRVAKDGTSS